jgi:hypothetical protein
VEREEHNYARCFRGVVTHVPELLPTIKHQAKLWVHVYMGMQPEPVIVSLARGLFFWHNSVASGLRLARPERAVYA